MMAGRSLDVIRLDQTGHDHLVGGKAAALGRLLALGVPVPVGVVISRTVFDRFLDAAGLRARIDHLDREGKATEIRALVESARSTPELHQILEFVHRELGGPVVAVRSSAVGEDGATASFAGQLDSVLGISSLDDLARALRTVWASYWSDRAVFYRSAREASLAGMGVIVQRQVPAVAAGVLFTRDPHHRAGAHAPDMMLEYCEGLADGLVTGQVDPARLRITRADLAVTTLATLDAEAASRVDPILTPARVAELAALALKIEAAFGLPLDIEWAIDPDGHFWIVQARPITTFSLGAPDVLWSNANVNENFPEPISPLLYSIASLGYYHYFRNLALAFGLSRRRVAAMERPLRGIIGVHGARMYYHLTNIHATLRMAPFGHHLTRAFNVFVGVAETAAQPSQAVSWRDRRSRLAQLLELGRVVVHTSWQFARLGRRVASFERTADAFASGTRREDLADRGLPDLLRDLHAFLDIRCHRWKNASLADAAAMMSYALLQRALAQVAAAPGTHNRVLRALPGVPSSTPPLRLWDLSRLIRADVSLDRLFRTASTQDILAELASAPQCAAFQRELTQYLDDWGFRSSSELMLTVPSLQEAPGPVIELLRQYATGEGESPSETLAAQARSRRAETAALLRSVVWRSPWRTLVLWRLIGWTQRAVAYRERARLKQALLYARCRQLALHIGDHFVRARLLANRDDIFMLTWQEIDDLGSGHAMFPYHVADLVARRRADHAELAAMAPPDTLRLAESAYLPVTDTTSEAPLPVDDTADGTVLHGISACGGRVTAPAAVLHNVGESHRLTRGAVLVTRQTDPGWGPVFCLISGLVIERGGMLSHGAIIAREFGLPCLVGVKDAARRITHGSTLTLDGDRGTCVVGEAQ
jgi:rifampicin phosphotransferase